MELINNYTQNICNRAVSMLIAVVVGLLISSQTSAQSYSGPFVITKGGTYTGNWESRDSEVPAVEIKTSEPVTIINSNIRGAGYLIKSWSYRANITVRNTNGYGLPPTPWRSYKKPRRFLIVDDFRNVVVENCYMEGTAGIALSVRYSGNGTESETIKIRYNKAKNIDGRVYGGMEISNFVKFNFRGEVPHAEIAWNEVFNEPNNSLVEENINLYNSRGTPHSPIRIHNNFLKGAYPIPATASVYSGGGILSDSPQDGKSDPKSMVTAHLKVYENHTVNIGQHNYGIASGNNIEVYNNRAINSGLFDDGTPMNTYNNGLYGYDYYKTGATFNNVMRDNVIGVMRKDYRVESNYFPDGTVKDVNNTFLPGKITKQDEINEYNTWLQKVQRNGLTIGPASQSNANKAPAVSIASPAANATHEHGKALTITANASDPDGSISKVEFFDAGNKLGEATQSPYAITIDKPKMGSYYLTATAIDNKGATSTSSAVSITISNKPSQNDNNGNGNGNNGNGNNNGGNSGQPITGAITREFWDDVHGGIGDIPVSKKPYATSTLNTFEAPSNVGDNYGQRLSGYITAPATGEYTFWISGDDMAELWLSSSESPSQKEKIASVGSWTGTREWDKFSSQQSRKIRLEAGKRYYIEALHVEGGGGDHLAVGWQLPSGAMERPIGGNRFSADVAEAPATNGSLTRELWDDVHGGIGDIPVSKAPYATSTLNTFEAPSNVGDNYGQRLSGYITAPATGDYTFWISGDDMAELWLSSSESPSQKEKIASVGSWTSAREWDKFSSQQSRKIRLEAGKRYYIEALHVEGGGGDHLAVGWQLPGGAMERPIGGNRLSPIDLIYTASSTSNATLAEEFNPSFTEKVAAYPNPFSDRLMIDFSGQEAEITQLALYDQSGKLVYRKEAKELNAGNRSLELDLTGMDIKSGLFILKYVDSEGKSGNMKVIKK
ncbi:PA14 domain-containing protein [Pontibacter sp. SGAir0037]|uniref:PA14 domain-containing protein n=1 Tax=Pontibacter sp. SGAir0037 TaxID=2571030 RepID=UPI0010CCD566|nr:PA14 domain-containing protein [Pontibacter sp. SGAir0037]QCR22098.1 hypothetical protein C1N53_06915 [Pontibacter sp. SGAir0037]